MEYNPTFSLRKLELSQPWLEAMSNKDAKAYVNLAALAMADEDSLKLYVAGNKDALQVFIDKAYSMEPDEVATLLGFFIAKSKRFSLILSGLSAEQVYQIEAKVKQGLTEVVSL